MGEAGHRPGLDLAGQPDAGVHGPGHVTDAEPAAEAQSQHPLLILAQRHQRPTQLLSILRRSWVPP